MKKGGFFDRVVRVVSGEIGFPENEIVPETNLRKDLKADSEDLIYIAMGLEDEFGVNFSDKVMRRCSTIQDIVEYVKKKKKKEKEKRDVISRGKGTSSDR